jgi:hypothetical protein
MNDLLPLTAGEFENSTSNFVTVDIDTINDITVIFDLNSDDLEVE